MSKLTDSNIHRVNHTILEAFNRYRLVHNEPDLNNFGIYVRNNDLYINHNGKIIFTTVYVPMPVKEIIHDCETLLLMNKRVLLIRHQTTDYIFSIFDYSNGNYQRYFSMINFDSEIRNTIDQLVNKDKKTALLNINNKNPILSGLARTVISNDWKFYLAMVDRKD